MRISDWSSDVCSSDLPWPVCVEFCLIGADRGVALFGQRNLVEPFEQAHLAERVDLAGEAILKLRRHGLMLELDEHRIGRRNLHKPSARRRRQDQWEAAGLQSEARREGKA